MKIKITESEKSVVVSTNVAADRLYEIVRHRVPRFDLLCNLMAMAEGKTITMGGVVFTAVE